MLDLETIGIGMDTSGLKDGQRELDKTSAAANRAADAADKASGGFKGMSGAAHLGAMAVKALSGAFVAWKIGDFIRDSALLAARFETMGVVMRIAGNNAGYTASEMEGFSKSLQKSGISMLQSRNSLTQLATANIDLANAAKLGRIAQDLAVVGNINSSEALGRLIHGIKSGEVEILKTIGLQVSFEGSYKRVAAQLGTTSEKLSENQKMMARTNAVLTESARYNGIYEESMTTAGKAMSSLTRFWEDFKVKAGEIFLPSLSASVFTLTDALKAANVELDKAGKQGLITSVGDALKGGLKVAFETIAVLGANVAFVLASVGREIGGIYAQMSALAGGDWKTLIGSPAEIMAKLALRGAGGFKEAANIRADMVKDAEASRAALDAFEKKIMSVGETAKVVSKMTEAERMAAGKAARDAAAAAEKEAEKAKERAEAMKKAAKEYESAVKHTKAYIQSLKDEREEVGKTDEQVKALKASREAAKGPTAELRAEADAQAKALAIETKAYKDSEAAIKAAAEANTKSVDDFIEADEKRHDVTRGQIKAASTMLEQIEFETKLLRMNTEERAVATAVRELETKGVVAGTLAYDAYIKKIREAVTAKVATDAEVDAAKKYADAWKSTWKSIDDTAHDVWTNIFDGGQDTFKRLGRTLKAALLDMLYQMTIKRWIINISGMVSGGGFAGMAQAGGFTDGSGGMSNLLSMGSLASNAGTLLTIGGQVLGGTMGLANAAGTVFANATGTGLSGLLATNAAYGTAAGAAGTGAAGAASGATLAEGASSALAAIPVWGWIALAGIAAYGMLASGEKRSGGQYAYGQTDATTTALTGGTQFIGGPSGGQIAGLQTIAAIDSTINGINATLLGLGSQAQLIGFQAAMESSNNGRGGVYAGGTLTGGVRFGDPGAGGGRSNYIGQNLYDRSKGLSLSGEEAIKAFSLDLKQATIEALQAATDIPDSIEAMLRHVDATKLTDEAVTALLGTIQAQLTAVGQFKAAMDLLPFAALRDLSFDAAIALGKATGGLEALTANLATYYDNFYSAEEKRANTMRVIAGELAKVGFALSESTLASLTRGDFRALVEQVAAMGANGQPAYAALLRVSSAFAQVTENADTAAQALGDTIASYRDLRKELQEFRAGLPQRYGQLSPEASYSQARTLFLQTRYKASILGDQDALGKLDEVSAEFLDASREYNATGAAYFDDLATVTRTIAMAEGAATEAISVAQLQLDALGDINTSVLNVGEQIAAEIQAAMAAAGAQAAAALATAAAAADAAEASYLAAQAADAEALRIAREALAAEIAAAYALDPTLGTGAGVNTGGSGGEGGTGSDGGMGLAVGGAFTNGIYSSPTRFQGFEMGENGSEAVMPLHNINGSLGVRVAGGGNGELVREVKRLQDLTVKQTDMIAALLRHQSAANTKAIATQERTADAVERGATMAAVEAARK
jgi:hypothetical protein